MKTVTASWESFQQHVIPADAPDVQLAEMKMAFHAGALSIFALMSKGLAEDEESLVTMLMGWQGECHAYFDYTQAQPSIINQH